MSYCFTVIMLLVHHFQLAHVPARSHAFQLARTHSNSLAHIPTRSHTFQLARTRSNSLALVPTRKHRHAKTVDASARFFPSQSYVGPRFKPSQHTARSSFSPRVFGTTCGRYCTCWLVIVASTGSSSLLAVNTLFC